MSIFRFSSCMCNTFKSKSCKLFANRFFSSEKGSSSEYEINIKTCGGLYQRWKKEKRFKSLPEGDLNFKVKFMDNYKNFTSKSRVPTFVAIHGAPGSWKDFSGLASYFEYKARVVVPSFPDFSNYRPGIFRFSAEEKTRFMKDFLAAISVSEIDALIVHSSGIYPGLLLCLDNNPVVKSLIMLNPGTYNYDMKATKNIKIMRKVIAASEVPIFLKIMQYIAPLLLKVVKLPVRVENVMDPLLSATTMVYAGIPEAKERFHQVTQKGLPIFYAFSNDDKLVGKGCSYELAYHLGASDPDIYTYDRNGIVMNKGKDNPILKVMAFERGSHYVFWKHADILHKEIEEFVKKI